MDNFGTNLKTLRKRMGMTQQELAEKLGVQKTTVSNYETSFSSPPKNVLVEIAQFFGVSLDELLGTPQNTVRSAKSAVMNSPSPVPFSSERRVSIFSSISDSSEITSIRNVIDTVGFSSLPAGEYFGLVASNASLFSRGIKTGDYIIFKSQQVVTNGDLVAASIDGNAAIVGIFHETESETGLIPPTVSAENQPVFFPKKSGSVKILGKAIKAIINIK